MTMFQDIKDFHEKYQLAYNGKPRILDEELGEFRERFMAEELAEYLEAGDNARDDLMPSLMHEPGENVHVHLEAQLDALVDLCYVAMGTAYLQGFDFEEAWNRVHAANMQKVRVANAKDSKRESSYDVIKPPGWTAPDHSNLVADHAHKG